MTAKHHPQTYCDNDPHPAQVLCCRQRSGRTYAINVREDLRSARMISGFLTLDRALDECARLNAQEDERRRRQETPDA
jgi:hypothetical protein